MKATTYTKKEIAKRVAERLGETVDGTSKFVDETFKVMKGMLCEDDMRIRIEIRNFGVFEVKPTKAKPRARNPRTNEEVFVPAHRKTHFKPGKLIKTHLSQPID